MKRTLLCLPLTAALALTACGNTSPTVAADPAAAPAAQRSDKAQSVTLQPLIVGGTISARGARPYQVAMTNTSGSQYCGGTLLSSTWVLTAAHCVKGTAASSIRIRAGVNKLSDSTQGQTVAVSTVTIHPSYRDASYGYDIALLKLSTAVNNPYAAPAKLPNNTVEGILDVKGKFAVVSGWGLTQGNNNSSASDDLREVSIPISPNPGTCGGSTVPGNTICGEYYQGKDSCNGDSGGPLAQAYNGSNYVLGIVSYGPSACTGNGVYTRVNGYLSWIAQVSGITADGGTDTTLPVTYTGSVSQGTSSYKPGTGGFSFTGGTLQANLTGPSGTDFDLYLQKFNGSTWADVASSESGTSTESINYAAASGTYRWEVYAYSGSGSYTLKATR